MGPGRTIAIHDGAWRELGIAAQVLARYPGAASPWRMTVEDYRDALPYARTPRAGARHPGPPTAPRTALSAEIAARGQAAHQEA